MTVMMLDVSTLTAFGGGSSDVILDPVDRGPVVGAQIRIYREDPALGATEEITDVYTETGEHFPQGRVETDEAGRVRFRTATPYDYVYGLDPWDNVYYYPSTSALSQAVEAGRAFPGVQAQATDAVNRAKTSQDTANEALDKATIAITASPTGLATMPGVYGDVSTPDIDITPALQAAYDSLPATGGRITFPPSMRLRFDGVLHISKDNITFDLNGSTLYKDAASSFGMFMLHSFRGKGYGGGPRKIKFLNGRLEGNFAQGRGFGLQLHHAYNILFDGVTFSQGMISAHYVELGGCKRVKFRDCTFEGCIPGSATDPTDHAWFNESVQLDYSYFDGIAVDADNLDSYDGLPCKDVTFVDCHWIPLTLDDGTTYPAPMITGQHVRMDGQWIENIKIKHCYAEGLQATWNDSPQTTAGWIHAFGMRNWKIRDTTFVNTSGHAACVFMCDGTSGATGIPLTPTGLTTSTPGSVTIQPMPSEDLSIKGCTFKGFSGPERQQIIVIKGYGGSNAAYPTEIHGSGIEIAGNYVDVSHPTAPPDNTVGQQFCGIYFMDGVTFHRNRGKQNAQILWLASVTGFTITGNVFPTVYDAAIIVSAGCSGGAISGNEVYAAGALLIDQATKVEVSGNTWGFLVAGYQNYVVAVTGTPSGIMVTSNLIDTKGSAATYGIRVTSGGANVVVTNNGATTSLTAANAFNFASGVQNANNYVMAA